MPEVPPTITAPKRSSWIKTAGRCALLYAFLPYVVLIALLAIFQRWLIFPATPVASISSENTGLPRGQLHAINVQSSDGLLLNGWLVLATGQTAHTPEQIDEELAAGRPLILYFPGNGGDRSNRVADCREFAGLGCDMVLFDYRGYGDNPGSPSESKISSDARAIWDDLTKVRNIAPGRVIVFGESLGGAVATRLTSELCNEGTPPAGLIVSSTFSSMADVAGWHYPYFPVRPLLLDQFRSADRITSVTCPIVGIHGTQDDIVPIELGRKLFAQAPAHSANGTPKRFIQLDGAGHNALPMTALRAATRALIDGTNAPITIEQPTRAE